MAVYRIVNQNIKDITDFIITNDELKKLLYYTSKSALSESVTEVGIKYLIENHVYPYPNNSIPEDNQKSFISIYMYRGKNAGTNNTYDRNIKIYVDVICHKDIWSLDEGLIRPLVLLDELDTNIPLIDTESIRGTLSYVDTVYIQYNNTFCGYRLIYSVTNGSRDYCID